MSAHLVLRYKQSYLIKTSSGYCLIDTGYLNQFLDFKNILGNNGINYSDINKVILTHHHEDHTGYASRLLKETKAQLIVHQNALPYLIKGAHDEKGVHWNFYVDKILNITSKIIKFGHRFEPIQTQESDLIINRNIFNLKNVGIDGKILFTPGHTSDSISIILSNGDTFVGDVAMNILGLGRISKRPFFVQNLNQIFESWRFLEREGAKMIFPAHGSPFLAGNFKSTIRNQ